MARPPINFDELLAKPEIAELLHGLWFKRSQFYYMNDGKLERAKVAAKLVALTSSKTATKILLEARRRGIIQTYEEPVVPAKATIKTRVKPRAVEPEPEDDDDEAEEAGGRPRESRWSLIFTSNDFWGIHDNLEGKSRLISREESDAIIELKRLREGEHKVTYSQFYTGLA
jgi:hypothetical protein